MERKPDIQYIGQFYIHGSEARELARKEQEKRAKTMLPALRQQRVQKVYIDPVALLGITVAVIMLAVMVIGAVSIHNAWTQNVQMEAYLQTLRQDNAVLEESYRAGYDLEDIRQKAIALGMIPIDEAQTIDVLVTVPVAEKEPTWWDDVVWFVDGLIE